MQDFIKYDLKFEEKDLTTVFYKGQVCWIAQEVGRLLEYSREGQRLINNISQDWSDEFIEGHDYLVLNGPELSDFKQLLELNTPHVSSSKESTHSVHAFTRHLMLLLEPGIYMVLAKTTKDIGKRLRRFIVDDVLPQIARDGKYIPERKVHNNELVQDEMSESERKLALAEAREARLLERDRAYILKTKATVRKDQSKALGDFLKKLKKSQRVSNDVIESYEVVAAEMASGVELSDVKPEMKESTWITPTAIATKLGVTPNRVGRIISELGLRGEIPGISRPILNKSKSSDRPVTSYLYSEDAVKKIEDHYNLGLQEGSSSPKLLPDQTALTLSED